LSAEDVRKEADAVDSRVKAEESIVNSIRRDLNRKQSQKATAVRLVAQREAGAYDHLWEARAALREVQKKLLPHEESLRQLKQERYQWNNIVKASKSATKAKQARSTKEIDQAHKDYSTPTWLHPMVEDSTNKLDISSLINARGKDRTVVFAGTDYGLVKMSETVALTHRQIQTHINRFQALA
ncbi:hypothetical protein BGX27_006180, partial [Mortierella sp. AM989]